MTVQVATAFGTTGIFMKEVSSHLLHCVNCCKVIVLMWRNELIQVEDEVLIKECFNKDNNK